LVQGHDGRNGEEPTEAAPADRTARHRFQADGVPGPDLASDFCVPDGLSAERRKRPDGADCHLGFGARAEERQASAPEAAEPLNVHLAATELFGSTRRCEEAEPVA